MLLQMAQSHSVYDWVIVRRTGCLSAPHPLYPLLRRRTCFHLPAIVNSAAVNTGVCVSFWIIVLSECMPKSGMADHVVIYV